MDQPRIACSLRRGVVINTHLLSGFQPNIQVDYLLGALRDIYWLPPLHRSASYIALTLAVSILGRYTVKQPIRHLYLTVKLSHLSFCEVCRQSLLRGVHAHCHELAISGLGMHVWIIYSLNEMPASHSNYSSFPRRPGNSNKIRKCVKFFPTHKPTFANASLAAASSRRETPAFRYTHRPPKQV